ncbi:ABC transporter permease [Clostridium beijerinckii]|uniref:ABC transporter permease n=1 Tax=Clostridium beijerinckii TaxID=1520 RepID=UPI0012B163F7|nr:ABC transporter permease [Clostridium beijerinckii]MRY42685.1 FtsX-like permease family protein [Parabacteroides distasonis]MZK52115.1 FtsX-like permease family protein [Clostridium beijerinckii]MZK61264.1 FtsX-like permease family protein [Clostridium beijerinckii]MZK71507.1 FtsX-like permease family protein [Clostridium beijerinckii]MZK76866.1 FtsX-like permease family protein [Clostridium beijerinckii]
MRFPLKVAVRFLLSNKLQTFFIVLGIGIGVSVQVFIGTLIDGLQKGLIDKTINNSPQITVSSTKDDNTIEDWGKKIIQIRESDSRIKNISPALDASAFIKDETKSYPVLMRGFQLEDSNNIYNIKNRIYEGSWILQRDIDSSRKKVLIGRELNKELKKKVGDRIKIITTTGKTEEFTISGFYDLEVSSINKSWIITDLKTVQSTFGFENKITSIEAQIQADDVFNADTVSKNVQYNLNSEDVKVENWKEQNKQLLSGLSSQSTSSYMIQFFVIVSVVLAIASILAITVIQKSKEIGILKAMGIKNGPASRIFLFQGVILGIFGAILGIIFGLGLTVMFTKFAVNSDGTPVVKLYINIKFIILSAFLAITSSSVAALIPANKTAKLDPIEVIKNG